MYVLSSCVVVSYQKLTLPLPPIAPTAPIKPLLDIPFILARNLITFRAASEKFREINFPKVSKITYEKFTTSGK